MKRELTAAQKSELCQKCGKCCEKMELYVLFINDEHKKWAQMHGVKTKPHDVIEYENGDKEYVEVFELNRPCSNLVKDGERYYCKIYDQRPSLCKDYEGTDADVGTEGCLWKEISKAEAE